jgi:Protein of unknown function, DUF488
MPNVIETFMWGYWGWGGSTKELVEAFGAAEKLRGYDPPVFVDIRIRREVRAVGFRGDAFEKMLGDARYRWMRGLGNLAILDGSPEMRLFEEHAVSDLLDLVIESHARRRRVIFFCACKSPRREGQRECHRDLVAELLVKEARRREVALSVVEWPGGSPRRLAAAFPREAARAARRGAQSVPLPLGILPADAVVVPWGSYALVELGDETLPVVVGPAIPSQGRWALQLRGRVPEVSTEKQLHRAIESLRKQWGYEARYSRVTG